ncbi:hypothetical protein MAPG_05053 [Magnaporthiopsis poae ATCC 64411]|uniref:J domain-containing protein n=1 Tax=Magnaporthiopsis poae (strain ATCC 64411 / 73-15) TaxID=644358 RepID=A0A0C4DYD5_MAGP6|nr:hypothetical protein MAPG_05053 [Magnaporthiopsis poae ATCC 64411]
MEASFYLLRRPGEILDRPRIFSFQSKDITIHISPPEAIIARMPSQPIFNYYSELGVDRSASANEIKAAYRRLALQHHPDKNHGNSDEATAKFQRVNEAAEVLMDETKRREYDLKTQRVRDMGEANPPDWYWAFRDIFSNFPSRFYEYREPGAAESTDGDGDDDGLGDWEKEYHFTPRARTARAAEGQARRAAKGEARRQAQEAENRKIFEEEEERRAAKEAAARAAADEKRRRKAEEQAFQARVWARVGAVTDEEVRESCLHSEHCTKTVERRKVKCDGCAVKRGIVAFHCPYCGAVLCTLCVGNFARVRKQRREAEEDEAV